MPKLVRRPNRDYRLVDWSKKIPEAIATNKCEKWCLDNGVNYRTFKRRKAEWLECEDKANYAFHKQTNLNKLKTSGGTRANAIQRFNEQYIVPSKPRNNNTLKRVLMNMHNERHPNNPIDSFSDSVIT